MPRSMEERFWEKVSAPNADGCMLWTAGTGRGYGLFYVGGGKKAPVQRSAHRVAYELLMGPIPDGLHLDHLCRVPLCVNPAHLEPVTPGENVRRGINATVTAARHAAVTHCPAGHKYTPENTYVRKGCRQCKACSFRRTRARRAQRKAGA